MGLCGKDPTDNVREESGVLDIRAAAEVEPLNPLDLSFFVLSRMVRRFCKMARFNIINLLEYNSTQQVEINPVEVFLFSHI